VSAALSVLRRLRGERLFLNAFALMGALVGLANAALAWRLYGTSANADAWLLALVVAQSLALLSQLGVEQFPVFSAEAHARDAATGRRFDRDSMTWAALFGMACAAVFALVLPWLVHLFADGYDGAQRARVAAVLLPLLLQVMFTPALFVLRQQLLLQGRARISIVSNNLFGYIQFLVLAVAIAWHDVSPAMAGLAVGLLSAIVAGVLVALLCEPGALRTRPDWRSLRGFIRASVAMRSTHSIHNFLVVLLTNNALSGGVPGTVAVYQYAKRIADGLASISIGPHLSVYHPAQSQAWALRDRPAFLANIRNYLSTAFPLLVLATLALLAGAAALVHLEPAVAARFPAGVFAVFLVLLAWQTLIALETVPVGVIVIDKRPDLLLVGNVMFVASFFLAVRLVLAAPYHSLHVAFASLACQVLGAVFFSVAALRLVRRRLPFSG
jgi:hypothetical protein